MAHVCSRCNKSFEYNYLLIRHKSRKFQCKEKQIEENFSNDDNTHRCEYCHKTYCRSSYLNCHKCMYISDPIRKLEIELNVDVKINCLTCRFCNTTFSRYTNKNKHDALCKKRDAYHKKLLATKEGRQKHVTIQNITNVYNTTTNNNIIINNFGNESLDHIDWKQVMNIIQKNRIEYKNAGIYVVSGQSVIEFHKLLQENEANRNMLVTGMRSQIAHVKTGESFEKVEINKALSDCFKNASKKFCTEINDKVPINVDDEVLAARSMSRNGFTNTNATKQTTNDFKRQLKANTLTT